MSKIILFEKYEDLDFPKHKTSDIQFMQGNKAIVVKQDKPYYKSRKSAYNWFQVGYIVIKRREVSAQLYQDSIDYMRFKKKFYIDFSEPNQDIKDSKIKLCLHSITQKKNHTIFGFKFKNAFYIGEDFDEEIAIPVSKFYNYLNFAERKIRTYGQDIT